jgi:hypothetical protein
MTTVHEAAKLTVSTESGISRSASNHLGVLEVSGPGMDHVTSQDVSFFLSSANVPQLSLGATDNSGIFQLGVDKNGNSILESTHNGQNQNILIQQLGGYVGVGTNAPASTFHIYSTDALTIPVGTTSERPGEGSNIIASNGMIRYNTTNSQFEGYGPGSSWGSLGGVKDVDGDTYIRAETYPGAGNNDLQFFTVDEERMVINSVGDISMNGDITTSKGYPYYQTLGTENVVNPPSTTLTLHGVNITAMNKRTRASYASAEACVDTWTGRSIPSGYEYWESVCWSPELSIFVAVAYGGTRVMTSEDGITWTGRSASGSLKSVCWSPELSIFVAVGEDEVLTSPDGITWTYHSIPSGGYNNNYWQSVCWSPELSIFVAVAEIGMNVTMTSPDGITWTYRSAPQDMKWCSVCWSPELSIFVAAGLNTNYYIPVIMTSPDGITWTTRTVPGSLSNELRSVCWSPELSIFVAVADGGTYSVITSPDGITWTARSALAGSYENYWISVCWSPELSIFVVVAFNGTRVMTSPDGITWTGRSASSSHWNSVCWSPELSIFVAVANSGTNRVMTSNIGMPNSKSVVKALPSQMSVLPNGNVGIGTTSPQRNLEVWNYSGTGAPLRLYQQNAESYGANDTTAPSNSSYLNYSPKGTVMDIVSRNLNATTQTNAAFIYMTAYGSGGATGVYLGNVASTSANGPGNLVFGRRTSTQGFAETMRIKSNGNVGIGTNNPSGILDVFRSSSSYGLIAQFGTTNGPRVQIANTNDNGIIFGNEYSSSHSLGIVSAGDIYISMDHNGNSSGKKIAFGQNLSDNSIFRDALTDTAGSSWQEYMTINQGGNVGIGTTNPATTLHVHGKTYITNGGGLATPDPGTYGSNGVRIVLWPGSSTGYPYAIGMNNSTMWFGVPGGARFSFFGEGSERVRIQEDGKVGIGTTSPSGPLHVYYKESADPTNHKKDMLILHTEYSSDFGGSYREGGCSIMFYVHNSTQSAPGEAARIVAGCYETSSSTEYHSYLAFHTSNNSSGAGTNERMIIDDNGYVGIGVTRPSAPLCIKYATNGNHDYGDTGNFRSGYYMRSYPRNGGASGAVYWYTDTWFSYELSILAEGGIYAKIGYIMASDERIKENITDVPDDIALEMLRKIPCRYYEYKDKYRRGTDKTIGFIAQEVKEVMPMAVSQQTDFIPNEMRPLEDAHWNNTTLYSDISDASGVSYKFFVSNDISGSDEQEINVIGNSDNSFTFEKSWNYVYCYGKQVDDFNAISKDKLFALNFSATQEIDKIQQEEISKLAEQTSRIDTIASENTNLNTKIENLEEENSLLSKTCDNLSLKILNMDKEISTLSQTNNNLSLKVLNLEQQIANILSIISSS